MKGIVGHQPLTRRQVKALRRVAEANGTLDPGWDEERQKDLGAGMTLRESQNREADQVRRSLRRRKVVRK